MKKSRASSRVTSFQITGIRFNLIQSGLAFSHASSLGSSPKQAPQPYQKPSTISTLPGGVLTGCATG